MNGGRRTLSFALCLVCSTVIVQAQTPPVASPEPGQMADAPDTKPPAYRLSVKVDRVVVDVVVSDARGDPVEGLTKDDFKVMEDGIVQPIRFFDAHTGADGIASRRMPDLHLPANTFSNLTPSPPDKPVTILFYDMLDTPQDALPFAHDQMVRFIKDRKDSSQIAIFALTDRLHMLQGFTDDETRLIQAINLKKATAQALILRDAPLTEDGSEHLLRLELLEMEAHAIRRLSLREEAFTEIARYVSALPGRKNLIWLSGSFPRDLFPDRPVLEEDPFLESGLRATRLRLIESRVALYPVDILGLQNDPQYSAATLKTIPPFPGNAQPNYFGLAQTLHNNGIDVLAKNTGGKAFYNTNGLKEAMDAAMRHGSSYYSLTYAPGEPRRDRREHEIKVVLDNSGYKSGYELSYRRRYLDPDDKSSSPAKPLALDASMKHGAPNSSELFFEAHVVPVGALMPASSDELRALAKFPHSDELANRAKRTSGPPNVQHYNIDFALIGRQLQMPALDDGRYATEMRFALAAYAGDSALLNGTEVQFKNSIPAEQFHKIESEGYHASILFAVPEDAVSFRMAVRDEIGGRIGTIEVPLPLPTVSAQAVSLP